MKIRHLLVCTALTTLVACGGDTAGGVANSTSRDLGNNTTEDMGAPDPDTGEALGETGDACAIGADCESGICINGACAEACTGDDDCPLGFSCLNIDVPTEAGGTETVSACIEDITCAANNDCPDPDVCVVDRAGNEIELTCDDPAGPGGIGDACTADNDCSSNLCLDDLCSAPCEAGADCGPGFVCESESLTTGGGSEDLTVCKPEPANMCASDGECTGTDRCVANKTMTEIEFTCGPAVGGGESGDACTVDADCAQNLCVAGICAGPCQSVGDCGGSPFVCDATNVDLGNGAMDSVQICQPPISCASQDDCPVAGGDVCYVREDNMTIDPICRTANVGGGGLGQVCGSEQECSNNFCLETRFRDVCSLPCVDDGDCGVAGYECGTVAVDLTGGGTEDVSLCVPEALTGCSSDADCATGLDCVIINNEPGTDLESVCVPTTGGVATGVACTADSDCASLVCLNDFCAAPCEDSTVCGGGQLCLQNTITKAPNSGDFNVCETLGDVQCTSSDNCTDAIRVCGDIRMNAGTGVQEGFCAFPNVGEDMLGTTCALPSDCREGVCLAGISDECSVICDKDGDCAGGQECTTFGDLNFCNTACNDNTDCGAPNRYCTINGDVLADEVDQVCENPIGASDIGTACATGSECLTGLCLRTLNFTGVNCDGNAGVCGGGEDCECPINDPNCVTGRECAVVERLCTNLCNDGGDCVGSAGNPMTDCNSNIFTQRPSGASAQISACSRP